MVEGFLVKLRLFNSYNDFAGHVVPEHRVKIGGQKIVVRKAVSVGSLELPGENSVPTRQKDAVLVDTFGYSSPCSPLAH